MPSSPALKYLLPLLTAAVLAGILAGSPPGLPAQAPAQKSQAAKPGSIKNEDCAVCHEDLTKAFDKNPHVVLEKSPKFKMENSCESCHGPGEDHASNSGDKTKIIGFKSVVNKKEYSVKCLACHSKDHELPAFAGSTHAKMGLTCVDCHRIHGGARMTRLLKDQPNDLCFGCHIQRRADFSKPFHHRVKENAMRCVDCHQPHSGIDRRQLRTQITGEIACTRCHREKEGPFVFEHAVLKIKNCQACHEPHGSNNSKMLVRSNVRTLCLECHSKTSQNVVTAQPPSFHDIRLPRYQNCTICHAKIHGSNASPIFLK
jgi:DmsE family decaheme c-type cytochrome